MLWWKLLKLRMGSPETRLQIIRELADAKDLRAVEPLAELLKDRDGAVPIHAAAALGQIGDPRAVQPLVAALRFPEGYMRRAAAEALGQIGAPALEPLLAMCADPSHVVYICWQ